MKIAEIFSYVALLFFIFFTAIQAGPMILLHLQLPPHHFAPTADSKKVNQFLKHKNNKWSVKPASKLARKIMKGNLLKNKTVAFSDFLATYAGYVTYANQRGLIAFPLRHKPATKLYLLISKDYTLTRVKGHTIAHATMDLAVDPAAHLYLLEQKEDKNKNLFWNVQAKELPKNKQLSSLTLTLHTKPKNIVVLTGDFLTEKSSHVIVPQNIYVLSNDENVRILLKSLDLAHYWEHISYTEELKKELGLQQRIIENE